MGSIMVQTRSIEKIGTDGRRRLTTAGDLAIIAMKSVTKKYRLIRGDLHDTHLTVRVLVLVILGDSVG